MARRQTKLLQLGRDAERHDNMATYHCWGGGLGLRTSLHSSDVFQCSARAAQAAIPQPCSEPMLSQCVWTLAQCPTTHKHSCESPALPRSVGIFVVDFGAGRISPHGHTHLLPDACACECLCMYIRFTVQSTYRKASSLFEHFSSTSYRVKSDPHCHSHGFSQLNGVKEPSFLPTAAITIRLGGRGNEQCSTRCTFQSPAIVRSTLL